MGSAHDPFATPQGLQAKRAARVMLVASPHFAWTLKELEEPRLSGLRVHEAMPGDPLPRGCGEQIDLMVIEVAPDEPASLERLSDFHARCGDVPIIAAIHDASLALVRRLLHEGVADVVGLPLVHDELVGAVLGVLAQPRKDEPAVAGLAPMVAVMRSIGGCGATSVATHLAAELAGQGDGRGVAIVDLDLQFGNVADCLGVCGHGSVQDLIDAGERLDGELTAAIARPAASGVVVFAAPDEIRPLETVSADKVLDVLDLLRRRYSHVVLDLPADIASWVLFVLTGSNAVVLVVEMSIPSLHQARRRLDLLRSIGVPADHVHVVVNRVERRLFRTIGLDDVARALGQKVLGSVALEAPAVAAAQDRGELLGGAGRKGRFASDIRTIAGRLTDIWQGDGQ